MSIIKLFHLFGGTGIEMWDQGHDELWHLNQGELK